MHITSHHNHQTLQDLTDRAIRVWKDLHAAQHEKLIARYNEIEKFEKLPWYKRWLAFAEPYAGDVEAGLHRMSSNIEFLRELQYRLKYSELMITLNDDETEILFTTAP